MDSIKLANQIFMDNMKSCVSMFESDWHELLAQYNKLDEVVFHILKRYHPYYPNEYRNLMRIQKSLEKKSIGNS